MQHDDIVTVYHPNSGLHSKVEHFEDYGRDEDMLHDVPIDMDPTAKFGTRIEFKFAELVLQCGLNNPQVDRLLKLVREIREADEASFKFRTHNDIKAAWDVATQWYTPVSSAHSII